MQQMIHQQQLIPYSILVKDPPSPYVHYPVPQLLIDERESLIWHTTPGAFVFHTRIHRRFIPVSFVKHPFPEQFSWFATSVQRNLPKFDLAFRRSILHNASV
jgi:hypothetical protein